MVEEMKHKGSKLHIPHLMRDPSRRFRIKCGMCAGVAVFWLLASGFWLQAEARPIITDVSDRHIKINAKFSGKQILLYGARVEAGNVIIVLRGPDNDYVVRKKENIGGLWVNTSSLEFRNVPQIYRIAASAPLEKIDSDILFKKLGIGFDTIDLRPKKSSSGVDPAEFTKALKSRLQRDGMFDFDVINLPFLEGTLFRIRLEFPAKIRDGIYTAEIYSFDDGQLLGMQSIPIQAQKAGLEAFIYNYAHSNPALYGLIAILIPVGAGLLAGRLFKKF